jgi:hypothetical protein
MMRKLIRTWAVRVFDKDHYSIDEKFKAAFLIILIDYLFSDD